MTVIATHYTIKMQALYYFSCNTLPSYIKMMWHSTKIILEKKKKNLSQAVVMAKESIENAFNAMIF